MKASDLLVKCLENEGVTRVYGIPGEENLDLMDSLVDSGIDFVLTRHESSAAFMAGMTGRLSGRPGACLSTLGPGAANLVIGVAEAYLGYSPMVAMSGQLPAECQRYPRKQYLDLMSVFRPITKACLSLREPGEIPGRTREAFLLAGQERPGPVFLQLPEDVLRESTDGVPLHVAEKDTRPVPEALLSRVGNMIASSRRPLILAGAGVTRAGASGALASFAEAWGLPVAMSWLGAGTLPFDHPLSLGTVGLRRADMMRSAFEASDLILLVGFDLMEFEPMYWNFGTPKRIIYLGEVPADEVPGFSPDLQLVGDLEGSLRSLAIGQVMAPRWTSDLQQRLRDTINTVPRQGKGVKPQAIVRAVRDSLGRDDIAISDVGAHLLWMAQRYPVFKENTLLMSNGLIPMGVGVPWAIAAKLEHPERKVVASVGDGSLAMSGMELETAKRLGTAFVTVLWDDGGLDLIRIKQEKAFGRTIGTEFGDTDWARLAESLGAVGMVARTSDELSEMLSTCLRDDVLAVIDVKVDAQENDRLKPS